MEDGESSPSENGTSGMLTQPAIELALERDGGNRGRGWPCLACGSTKPGGARAGWYDPAGHGCAREQAICSGATRSGWAVRDECAEFPTASAVVARGRRCWFNAAGAIGRWSAQDHRGMAEVYCQNV